MQGALVHGRWCCARTRRGRSPLTRTARLLPPSAVVPGYCHRRMVLNGLVVLNGGVMDRNRAVFISFAVLLMVGLTGACTPGQQPGVRHEIPGVGTFDIATSDGFSDSSDVEYQLSYWSHSSGCGLRTGLGTGNNTFACSVAPEGTMTAHGAIPGEWQVQFGVSSECYTDDPDCGHGLSPVRILLMKLNTPDGLDGIRPPSWPNNIWGEVTGDCVRFEGTSTLRSNRYVDVDVDMTICSPALIDVMEAHRA